MGACVYACVGTFLEVGWRGSPKETPIVFSGGPVYTRPNMSDPTKKLCLPLGFPLDGTEPQNKMSLARRMSPRLLAPLPAAAGSHCPRGTGVSRAATSWSSQRSTTSDSNGEPQMSGGPLVALLKH